jgi:hypothetical protein
MLKFNQLLTELGRKHSADMASAEKLAHTLAFATAKFQYKDRGNYVVTEGKNWIRVSEDKHTGK